MSNSGWGAISSSLAYISFIYRRGKPLYTGYPTSGRVVRGWGRVPYDTLVVLRNAYTILPATATTLAHAVLG